MTSRRQPASNDAYDTSRPMWSLALTGRPETRAEGRAQERKGEAQNLKGKVKGAFGDKI